MPKSDAQARSVYIKSTFSDSPRPDTNMLRYQSNYREGRRKLDFPLDIYKCGPPLFILKQSIPPKSDNDYVKIFSGQTIIFMKPCFLINARIKI